MSFMDKEIIKNINSKFNNESNDDLIDACIYELKAQEARYEYLIKKAKSDLFYKEMNYGKEL